MQKFFVYAFAMLMQFRLMKKQNLSIFVDSTAIIIIARFHFKWIHLIVLAI